ncbi:ATP-binding protein [Herbaspirillum lusitanum]|uniref:histidine kinase n=1 Tax=Herbaspirillum lusitanum TaxID=213312 RepID=A0ABW9AB04_9BURK
MTLRILTASIRTELDVVSARQRARQIAALCHFGHQDQVRIATTVSELARNIFNYADTGRIEFCIEGDTSPQILVMLVEDVGPGIAHLDAILAGTYLSSTGMGLGIPGARKLMDVCNIETELGKGTRIELKKLLPSNAPLITSAALGVLSASLASLPPNVALAEVQQQNHELLGTLAELKARQEELMQLTRELEDTNRGVVALYAELDEKAEHLKRADEMKSRFLSNMSHEFRTPLSSIRALSKLLLDRVDGELSVEQEKQVNFILSSAVSLSELVNDLLDLAKIEAGKIEIRPSRFEVVDMFSALRGMLRPLLVSERLNLSFVPPAGECRMYTDEGKVSQILRNFISNALKFTEAGDVIVSATLVPEQNSVRFTVADTGIGIAEKDLGLIFEEFSQVENPLQRRTKGTGLGLPLCRQLALLLNGYVTVTSTPGQGSAFSAVIPRSYEARREVEPVRRASEDDTRIPVMVVEDHPQIRMIYEKFFVDTEFRMLPASDVHEAETVWERTTPKAVILDILLNGRDSWQWLVKIKNDPARQHVPVIVATEVDDKRKGLSLGADVYYLKPLVRNELLGSLRALLRGESANHTGRQDSSDLSHARSVSDRNAI